MISMAGRPEPPTGGDEVSSLLGFLDFQRATLAAKCAGLDAAGLAATLGPSTITLGGLLKHLAFVEDDWFGVDLHDLDRDAPWADVDVEGDPDWAWRTAADDDPATLVALWDGAVARSRQRTAEALADGGLDGRTRRIRPDGFSASLRWILLHMIEEYARHNGHADLLRESVDGAVGE